MHRAQQVAVTSSFTGTEWLCLFGVSLAAAGLAWLCYWQLRNDSAGNEDDGQNKTVLRVVIGAFIVFWLVALQTVLAAFTIGRIGYAPAALDAATAVTNYGFAIGIGLLVGATELISRYRDEPFAPLVSTPGAFYIFLNGGASALAYYLLGLFGSSMHEPLRTLTAGLAAMAFFRSALFNVRLGTGGDVPVGPNLVLLVILKALDRTYDRTRAEPRSALVRKIVGALSFSQVKKALPALCFDLMQNLSPDETAAITNQVNNLSQATDMSDESKMLSLGLALLNLVGSRTLQAAVDTLGANANAFQPLDDSLLKVLALQRPDVLLSTLPGICEALRRPGQDAPAVQPFVPPQGLSTDSQVVLLAYRLVNQYGNQLVTAAANIVRAGPPPVTQSVTPIPATGSGA